MSDEFPTPSQAEGERDDAVEADRPDVPQTTPSQAEGEDTENEPSTQAAEPGHEEGPGPVRRQDLGG
ncbi:hypothetical protein ACWC24_35455 [Streptomyces sp. NPDC001443]